MNYGWLKFRMFGQSLSVMESSMKFSFVIFLLFFTHVVLSHNRVVVINFETGSEDEQSNIITVANAGGDFSDIYSALGSIDSASSENPYLIVLAPGLYEVKEQIRMKPYVNITGSGTELTSLVSKIPNDADQMIVGAGNSILSDLSIELVSTLNRPTKNLMTCETGCTDLQRINARVTSTVTGRNMFGILVDGSDLNVEDSYIRVSGRYGGDSVAISVSAASLQLSDVDIAGSGTTLECFHCYLGVKDSQLSGGLPIRVVEGSPGDTIDISQSVLLASTGPTIQNPNVNAIPVYISRSSLKRSGAGDLVSGPEIFCVTSDNGLAEGLDRSCSIVP